MRQKNPSNEVSDYLETECVKVDSLDVQTLRAARIELIDSDGKSGLALFTDAVGTPWINWQDQAQGARLVVGISEAGDGVLSMYGKEGGNRIDIFIDAADKARMELSDATGERQLVLCAEENTVCCGLLAEDSSLRVAIAVDGAGLPSLQFFDSWSGAQTVLKPNSALSGGLLHERHDGTEMQVATRSIAGTER